MKRTLLNEVSRQLKLMGVKTQITESITHSAAIEFIHFAKIGAGLANRDTFTNLFEKAAKEAGAGLNTIEAFEKDYALFKNTGKSNIPPSVYAKIVSSMLKNLAKESTTYKKLSESLLNAYRGVFGLTPGTAGGDIIDTLIDYAKKANNDESFLKKFESLVIDIKSRNIIDSNITTIIRNLYFVKTIPTDIIKTMDGFVSYLKTLPGFKQYYAISAKKEMDRVGMTTLFSQVDSILRQVDEAVLEGQSANFDLTSARNLLSKLMEKISYGDKDLLKYVWLEVKQKLPGRAIEQLESKDGVLNYDNLREWLTYYEKAAGNPQIQKPNLYVSRLEALFRIFKDPNNKELSRWNRFVNSSIRILKEWLIGSARTKEEVAQLVKLYGKKGKLGFNIGERLVAYVFYYPLVAAFLRTLGDYVENTRMINKIPGLADTNYDFALLHGETWVTPGVRKGGNVEGLVNSLTTNMQSYLKPFNPSFRQLSVLSPAFADIVQMFETTKSGDMIDPTKIDEASKRVIIEQRDTLDKLRTEGADDPELMKLLDTVGMKPLNITQNLLSDSTQN